MGSNAFVDLRAFRATQMHRHGVNVVVPVLPLHGARASGRVRGEDLMTIDLVDSMHGMAQATSDLRRVVRWLRQEQGADSVGVIGYSLGGLVASLVASLEDDLACVVAGIPVVGLPDLFRRHTTDASPAGRAPRRPRRRGRRRPPRRLPPGDGVPSAGRAPLRLRRARRPHVHVRPGPSALAALGPSHLSPPTPVATWASTGRALSSGAWTSALTTSFPPI